MKNSTSRETFSRSQRQGIEYYMGKDKDLVAESPGPGTYVMPKLIGDMPTYSLPKISSKRSVLKMQSDLNMSHY